MNQLLIAGIGAVVVATGAFTAGWKTSNWRHDSQDLAIAEAAQKAGDAATMAATDILKSLRPQFTTINRPLEKEYRSEVRYTSDDCSHTDPAWGLLDRAYQAAGGEPFGDRPGLSDAAAATGQNAGGDDTSTGRGVGSDR